MKKLIPRFLRLSALVAAELGREFRGEDSGKNGSRDGGGDSWLGMVHHSKQIQGLKHNRWLQGYLLHLSLFDYHLL